MSLTAKYWAEKAAEVEAELLARVPENNIRPRLEPTRMAVELLGDPQQSYKVIHITGTNGKTSTSRFIERILREFGIRTGRFTSPHLVRLNERLAIDGEPVSDQVLYEVWQDTKPILELVDLKLASQGEAPLTFFEALAALGFAVFADAPIEVLVLEVGMGGEWDSTNVADGDVAVFTPIGIDHTDRLGETISEIAATKSGIIKPGSLVVSAPQPDDAYRVLSTKSQQLAEALFLSGANFSVSAAQVEGFGQRFSVESIAGSYQDLFIPVLGSHQVQNAALAIAAVEAFMGAATQPIPQDVLRAALADVSSPGRLQVISREPLTILDAAHNPHGAQALSAALQNDLGAPYTVAVVSILSDKDAAGFFEALDESVHSVVVTQSNSPRAIPVNELADIATQVLGSDRVVAESDPQDALKIAQSLLPADVHSAIVITGSVTLVGQALAAQQRQHLLDGDEDDDEDHDRDPADESDSHALDSEKIEEEDEDGSEN